MATNSFLSRWFKAKNQPVETVPEKTALVNQSSGVLSSPEISEAAPKAPDLTQYHEVQDMVAPPTYVPSLEDIKKHWMLDDEVLSRAQLVQEHPFFQKSNFWKELDIEMYISIVEHTTSSFEHNNLLQSQLKSVGKNLVSHRPNTVLLKNQQIGMGQSLLLMQQRGFELAVEHPQQATHLYLMLQHH